MTSSILWYLSDQSVLGALPNHTDLAVVVVEIADAPASCESISAWVELIHTFFLHILSCSNFSHFHKSRLSFSGFRPVNLLLRCCCTVRFWYCYISNQKSVFLHRAITWFAVNGADSQDHEAYRCAWYRYCYYAYTCTFLHTKQIHWVWMSQDPSFSFSSRINKSFRQ